MKDDLKAHWEERPEIIAGSRIVMIDAGSPDCITPRVCVVHTTVRLEKPSLERYWFVAFSPVYEHESDIHGPDGPVFIRRHVSTIWHKRHSGRRFWWSEKFGRIFLGNPGVDHRTGDVSEELISNALLKSLGGLPSWP